MDYIAHHGIKGMRWGVRNWQNPDGSLTEEGRKRYGVGLSKAKNIAKTIGVMAKYSDAGYAVSTAKRKASRNLNFAKSKANRKTDALKKSFDKSLNNARSVYRSKSDSIKKDVSRNVSRKLNKASIDANILKREFDASARKSVNSIMRLLDSNTAEAARLKSYVDSDKFKRLQSTTLSNLRKQKDYAARKAAGVAYLQKRYDLNWTAKAFSTNRYEFRDSVGDLYRYYKTSKRRGLNGAAETYDDKIKKWLDVQRYNLESTKTLWNRARGR